MFSKFLINIILLFMATSVNAGDKKKEGSCYKAKDVKELQTAIDDEVKKHPLKEGHPTVVSLCKGTKVLFKKGDKTVKFPELGLNLSFVLKCEDAGTCVMDGGILQKEERLFVGDGGFSTVTINDGSLFIEGILFQNFGVTGAGGVFLFSLKGLSHVYFYKCSFFENIAKGAAGGAIFVSGSDYVLFMLETVHFKGNRCPNGFGGALAVNGNTELRIEKGRFNHNEALYGGAITAYDVIFTVAYVDFEHNKADDGGALYYGKAYADWFNIYFKGNEAAYIGEAYFQFDNSWVRGVDTDFNKDKSEAWCNPSRSFIEF